LRDAMHSKDGSVQHDKKSNDDGQFHGSHHAVDSNVRSTWLSSASTQTDSVNHANFTGSRTHNNQSDYTKSNNNIESNSHHSNYASNTKYSNIGHHHHANNVNLHRRSTNCSYSNYGINHSGDRIANHTNDNQNNNRDHNHNHTSNDHRNTEKKHSTSTHQDDESLVSLELRMTGSSFQDQLTESDPQRLRARQKQIDIGLMSQAYAKYIKQVPKHCRDEKRKLLDHPVTPNIRFKCSKRCFDGLVSAWRRRLHEWDAKQDESAIAQSPQQPTQPQKDLILLSLSSLPRHHQHQQYQQLLLQQQQQQMDQHVLTSETGRSLIQDDMPKTGRVDSSGISATSNAHDANNNSIVHIENTSSDSNDNHAQQQSLYDDCKDDVVYTRVSHGNTDADENGYDDGDDNDDDDQQDDDDGQNDWIMQQALQIASSLK
jgi:histone RNA hairpin-binding protein